jgi:hypothetical protein
MYEEATRWNVGDNSMKRLGGMQNFIGVMENSHP